MSHKSLMYALTLAAILLAHPLAAQEAPAAGQTASLQTTLASDLSTLSDKFVGLARVMVGKYDWRPGQGVRSVGEVFNLIISENTMLANQLSGAQGGSADPSRTDATQLQDALATSYATLKQVVAGLSNSDLNASVTMFRRNMPKQNAVLLLILDQHEHLGQSIAYARTNGIVPPWSK